MLSGHFTECMDLGGGQIRGCNRSVRVKYNGRDLFLFTILSSFALLGLMPRQIPRPEDV